MPDRLRISQRGGYQLVELARPSDGNSIDEKLLLELETLVSTPIDHSSVDGIIFTGSGDKFFCAGGDVKYLATLSLDKVIDFTARAREVLINIEQLPVRTIAVINGYAIGGGLELALACDFRIANESAGLSMPQLKLGLTPGWHGISRLRAIVGYRAARDVLLSARTYQADEAHEIGLVDGLLHDGEPMIDGLARLLPAYNGSKGPDPHALSAVKSALSSDRQIKAGRDRSLSVFAELWCSEAHREAERVFAQRSGS